MTEFQFEERIVNTILFSIEDTKSFSELTGDKTPHHLELEFAQSAGFESGLVHGCLLDTAISGLSQEVSVAHRTLLLERQSRFHKPVYWGSEVEFEALKTHYSTSTGVCEYKVKGTVDSIIVFTGRFSVKGLL